MHERDKLQEAEYYSKLAGQSYKGTFKKDRSIKGEAEQEFGHLLSAFLTAARCVLQYASEEVKGNKQGQRWFSNLMAGSPELRYFRDKRNINIHERPVALDEPILSFTPTSPPVSYVDKDGRTWERSYDPIMTSVYFFDDRADAVVVTLARTYLDELHQAVSDGIQQGFISG